MTHPRYTREEMYFLQTFFGICQDLKGLLEHIRFILAAPDDYCGHLQGSEACASCRVKLSGQIDRAEVWHKMLVDLDKESEDKGLKLAPEFRKMFRQARLPSKEKLPQMPGGWVQPEKTD